MNRTNFVAACGVLTSFAATALAENFLVNGGFETQALPPWTVVPTPNGTSIATAVAPFDIDGAGPLPTSPAVRLFVGQTTAGVGYQGAALTQTTSLDSDFGFEVRFDWAILALVSFNNATAGRFEIVVDGVTRATAEAPRVFAGQRLHSRMGARITELGPGEHTVALRVTRPTIAGEEIFQFIDNVRLRRACRGDADESGAVGFSDLNLLLTQFGQTGAGVWPGALAADINFDGAVNMADLNFILSAFGSTCPGA